MFDVFNEYATDDGLENNGTWMEVGEAEFLVARAGNKKYTRKLSKAVDRNKRLLDRKDDAADKLSEEILIGVIAETILLGWKNVAYKGEMISYSADNAKMLLAHKDFRGMIMDLANDFDRFKAAEEQEAKED